MKGDNWTKVTKIDTISAAQKVLNKCKAVNQKKFYINIQVDRKTIIQKAVPPELTPEEIEAYKIIVINSWNKKKS
jgi:hypothetical protein